MTTNLPLTNVSVRFSNLTGYCRMRRKRVLQQKTVFCEQLDERGEQIADKARREVKEMTSTAKKAAICVKIIKLWRQKSWFLFAAICSWNNYAPLASRKMSFNVHIDMIDSIDVFCPQTLDFEQQIKKSASFTTRPNLLSNAVKPSSLCVSRVVGWMVRIHSNMTEML